MKELVKNHIKNIYANTYTINCTEDEYKKLENEILILKNNFNRSFTIDDFVLVRVVKEPFIPINMEYYPLDNRNANTLIDNPYGFLLTCIKYNIDTYSNFDIGLPINKDIDLEKENKLVSYYYRDTKHFSINSLASNVNNILIALSNIFDNGNFIIIEPLKNNINNPCLKVLNPADTFFDLHNTSLKIGEDATILIDKNTYNRLDNETIKNIGNRKIFIFNCKPQIAVDIVLLYLDIIPQHTKNQIEFERDISKINNRIYTNDEYLEKYKLYIEYLNNVYLNSSYLFIPEYIKQNRMKEYKNLNGIFHCETKYADDEIEKSTIYKLDTYQEYLNMISTITDKLNDTDINKLMRTIIYDIESVKGLPILQRFNSTYRLYENLLLDSLNDIGYNRFHEYTQNFNSQKLLSLDKNRIG